MMNRETLKALAFPGIVALVLVGAGIALLTVVDDMFKQSARELARVRSERIAIHTKLMQATDEEQLIRKRLAGYDRLLQKGVIGDERRLDWVDAIQRIRNERKLFELKYSIEPRRPVDYPGFKHSGDIEFAVSRMRLELMVLHEGDLLNTLNDIRSRLAPHVVVRTCKLDRLTSRFGAGGAIGPQLRAECGLDLITIRDRNLAPS
jgi:hypothetical protein